MSTLISDIKYGFRQLRKNPGFTVVAVLTLGLGIGANVTMFGFVNTYLLEPLPFVDADRLVAVQHCDVKSGEPSAVQYANFLDWQAQNQSFEALACYSDYEATLNSPGVPEKLKVMLVTADLLPMLGIQPAVGRFFTSDDNQPQSPMTALISYGLWQRRFGADPKIVGQAIELDGQSATVVGVLPKSFAFPHWYPDQGEIWQPLRPWIEQTGLHWLLERGNSGSTGAIGKLKPSVTLAQAHMDMDKIARYLQKQYPDTNRDAGVYVTRFQNYLVKDFRSIILLLTGAVIFVLLIVCTNLANLLLIRSCARIQEFSVRSALGAGYWRIIRQIICESLVLVTLGGSMGILLALWGSGLLAGLLPAYLQPTGESLLSINSTFLLFILGLIMITVLLSSLASILHMSRIDLAGQIRSQTRSVSTNIRWQRLRDSLVVAEMTLAMVLLVGAGLMLNSFIHYLKIDPGYDPERVITLSLALSDDAQQREQFCRQLLNQVNALPGVKHTALTSALLGKYTSTSTYTVEGQPDLEPGQSRYARWFEVTPGFFKAMGMRLVQGRHFTERDMTNNAIIVDQAFVEKWWPNENPIGQYLNFRGSRQVIGVVSRVHYYSIEAEESLPTLYQTGYRWWPSNHDRILVVRTQTDPADIVGPIRRIVTELDASIPIYDVQTVHEIINEQLRSNHIITGVLGGFAAVALLLVALGIYGVLAASVAQRTQEIGIRMAMGARVGNILRTVLCHGLKLTAIGLTLGLCGSLFLTRTIESYLFGVSARDAVTLAVVTAVLTGTALLACWIPARRAAKIDPMEALRYE
jgi:putative ABC transport system permease protein